MDALVTALGPAFACGFALQQLLELLDPLLSTRFNSDQKKIVMGLLSLAVGLGLAFGTGVHVLQPLGVTTAGIFDPLVTGVVISAGTEGFNTIMKFMGYAKADQKAKAATSTSNAAGKLALVDPNSKKP